MAILLAVYRNGGIVAASDTLRISPSAISQQIRLLEKEAGVQLLERTPRGAQLTNAGRLLTDAAERIEAEITGAQRELLASSGQSVTGMVRVGSFQTGILALLLPVREQISQLHPGIELRIYELDDAVSRRRLRSGELDMMLLEADESITFTPTRSTKDIPLTSDPWVLAVPPHQPVPTSLSELTKLNWLDMDISTAGGAAMRRLEGALGHRFNSTHEINDYSTGLTMVAQGLGYCLVPHLALGSFPAPAGVVLHHLTGLGGRKVVLRHRATRLEPDAAASEVIRLLTAKGH